MNEYGPKFQSYVVFKPEIPGNKIDILNSDDFLRNLQTFVKTLSIEVNIPPNIIVDLSSIEKISPTGLNALRDVQRQLKSRNGEIVLADLQKGPKEGLELTGYAELFKQTQKQEKSE